MNKLPIDILKEIAFKLDWEVVINYFKSSKRLYKLNNDNFWLAKIKRDFGNIRIIKYKKEFCNYLAIKNISLLYLFEEDPDDIEIYAEIIKISSILIDHLKKQYPNNFKIYYTCHSDLNPYDFNEIRYYGSGENNLIINLNPKTNLYNMTGFHLKNNKVVLSTYKIGQQNSIKFPKLFLNFILSLGLPLSSIRKLYDTEEICKMDFDWLPPHNILTIKFIDKDIPTISKSNGLKMQLTGGDKFQNRYEREEIVELIK